MTAKLIAWRCDAMAVCVEDRVTGRRTWRPVDWINGVAYFDHITTRYRINEWELVVVELLSRPVDGSDQASLPLADNPGPATAPVKREPKKPRTDQPSLFGESSDE